MARSVLVVSWFVLGCERGASESPLVVSTGSVSARPLPSRDESAPPLSAAAPQAIPSYRTPIPARERAASAPAKRYAALSGAACRAEVAALALPVKAARGKTAGMVTPLELTGPLNGVRFVTPRGVYGFMDCRLVLMLADLANHLSSFGVVEVQVNNTYRPGAERVSQSPAPKPKPAAKSKTTTKKTKTAAPPKKPQPERLSQHARGLAIDIDEFRLSDGRALNVERDWHGKRGEAPCGETSRVSNDDPAGVDLRDLVCSMARAAFCNHLITPSRDEAHENHVHCDIEEGANEIMLE